MQFFYQKVRANHTPVPEPLLLNFSESPLISIAIAFLVCLMRKASGLVMLCSLVFQWCTGLLLVTLCEKRFAGFFSCNQYFYCNLWSTWHIALNRTQWQFAYFLSYNSHPLLLITDRRKNWRIRIYFLALTTNLASKHNHNKKSKDPLEKWKTS